MVLKLSNSHKGNRLFGRVLAVTHGMRDISTRRFAGIRTRLATFVLANLAIATPCLARAMPLLCGLPAFCHQRYNADAT